MPRAKRKKKPIELQPWCYYCDKVCADVVALEAHIRMRHSSCTECTRRPGSMSGLVKHMASVHKMELSKVPNAIGKRSDPSVDVYGMMGNPLARTYHPSKKILCSLFLFLFRLRVQSNSLTKRPWMEGINSTMTLGHSVLFFYSKMQTS